VATLSDSTDCKVKSWLSQIIPVTPRRLQVSILGLH
jgi:hypothetical protein